MFIGDIFKSKKQRLINRLNRADLYPQAILISQFDGSNWIMNDDRVSLEIDLLLAQSVSREAALISFSRFIRSKELAYSLNLSKEALFLNEYCIIYRLYIDLLDSLENDSESISEKVKLKDKSKLMSRLTIKELLSPDLPIKKSISLNNGVEEGMYFVSELNDNYQLFIFFSNPRNAIQEFKKIISRYVEKAVSDKISSQNIQLWQNNIIAVNSSDDSKFEKWIIETKEHVFFALSNKIVVQLSKGVKLYRIDFLGLTSIDLDSIITPVFGPIVFNKPYSNPTRDTYSIEKLNYSNDQINRIVLFLFSLFSDGDNLLFHESKYFNVSMKDFDSFSNSEEFEYLFDNLLKIEIGKDWLDDKIIEQVFNWFHSKYTNYERILILSDLYRSVRNGNVIKVKSEKFDKLKKAYLLSCPGSALRNHNSNRIRDLFGVNLTLLIMQTNIEKEKTKFDKYAVSLGLTSQEFFEHLLVTNDEELEKYRDELTLGLPLNFIDLPTNLKVNTDKKDILESIENEKLNLLLRDNKIKDAYNFLLTKLEIINQRNFDFNQYNFKIILNFAGLSINIQEDLERFEIILNSIALDARFKDIDVKIQSEFFGVLGLNQSYQNKEYDAIENFTNALDLNPLDARSFGNRGCSYFNIGDLESAILDLDNAIDLGLDDKFALSGIYSNKARCLIQLIDGFDFESENYLIEAKNAISKAIELSPEEESHQDTLFRVEMMLTMFSQLSEDSSSNEDDE